MRDRLIQLILECSTYTPEYTEQARLHAEYVAQHLLNNGVVVPKVKIGDKLYELSASKTKIDECTITHFEVGDNDINIWGIGTLSSREHWVCKQSELGNHEWVYLTREEAERALAERRDK